MFVQMRERAGGAGGASRPKSTSRKCTKMERTRKWRKVGLALLACCTLAAPASAATGQPARLQGEGFELSALSDGSYAITATGVRGPVLRSVVAAEVDHRWIASTLYPTHRVEAGSGQIRIVHTGLSGQPDLVCELRVRPADRYGTIEVQVSNRAGRPTTVQAIRMVQAMGSPVVNLGGPEEQERVLSDSYSEDRPELKIYDLGAAEDGMHRAVGSQLIYNRASHNSLFLGVETSRRLLTIFHLQTSKAAGVARVSKYEVDSTGTTEILRGESLKTSPPEDRMELSIPLNTGETLASERLRFSFGNDYHAQLEQYGAAIRSLHHARVSAPTPMGWWSWTAYYFGLNSGMALTNARWLAQHLLDRGYRYFHIDEGYQYARGEYTTPDAVLFPRGVQYVGQQAARLGLTFGVWTAPFEVSERSSIYAEHKDWLVKNAAGRPIHIGYVIAEKKQDPLYALDPTHPGAQGYLRQTYGTLAHDWGVRYIKLDFMDDSAIEGRYYRPNTTALEAQRVGLQVIRDAVGDEVLLDKDGSPMLNPVGLVDAGRISVDTGHMFRASKEAAPGIAARYYMNRNFFISDPDASGVSRQAITDEPWHGGLQPQTLDEAKVSIVLAAVCGGMFEIGDDLPTLGLDADRLALVTNSDVINMARLGRAARPLDLMDYATEDEIPSVFLVRQDGRQAMLAVFNWTEQARARRLRLSDLKLPAGHNQVFDVFSPQAPLSSNADELNLNVRPHSVVLLKIIDTQMPASGPSVTAKVPGSAGVGVPVSFSAETDEHGPAATSWQWDFGDGTRQDGKMVDHTYTVAAQRTVTLSVEGLAGTTRKTFPLNVTGAVHTNFEPAQKKRP
jgi:alpha-galactosidase